MRGTSFAAVMILLPTMACAVDASSGGADATELTSSSTAAVASAGAGAIAGTYMFHIATPRGPEVGNWSLHADGTLYSVANGAQIAAGTWTADASTITIVRSIPYGNHCTYVAPRTPTGFAATASPSPRVTCTWNRLRANPPSSWYAVRLP
jgi:hypothetical protein